MADIPPSQVFPLSIVMSRTSMGTVHPDTVYQKCCDKKLSRVVDHEGEQDQPGLDG